VSTKDAQVCILGTGRARGAIYWSGLLRLMERAYGRVRLPRVLEAVSRPPREYAVRVNTLRATPREVVAYFSDEGFECRESEVLEEAVLLRVEGPFEIERSGKRVLAEKHAAESVMMGSNLYAPGVLASDRLRPGEEVYIEDVMGNVVARGEAAESSRFIRGRRGIAVRVVESRYRLPKIRESRLFRDGKIQEQSLPAMITSRVLDPRRGEFVVDMCAAPGGKALHIAQIADCEILAFDDNEKRLGRLETEAERLGISRVRAVRADSRYLTRDRPELRLKADKVLVDPPCSALGVRPKTFEELTAARALGCAGYQRQFLRAASEVVREGGEVVYSTCTLTLEENEENARYCIEELGLAAVDQPIRVGGSGIGFSAAQRFDPDLLEMPGYFIAKFRK